MNPEILKGKWLYRSFIDDSDPDKDPRLFGQGILTFKESCFGVIEGDFDFGQWGKMEVKGSAFFGDPNSLNFRGRGIADTPSKDWVYDYKGYLLPKWVDGVEQKTAVVGTVIRAEDHSGGQAKAGVVASFIMIKID